MTAGDTRKVIVIKNISSNFIEEAILILKNENGSEHEQKPYKTSVHSLDAKNDSILKEAERIINEYIRANNLTRTKERRRKYGMDLLAGRNVTSIFINILLMLAVAFLIFAVSRIFQ